MAVQIRPKPAKYHSIIITAATTTITSQLLVKRRNTQLCGLTDFQPIAVETLGPINESATSFLYDMGRRISLVSGEDREPQFLFQRISVAIQRFNAVLLHDGFLSSDHPD